MSLSVSKGQRVAGVATDPRTRLFRRKLLRWGKANVRQYPWRYASDPYAVILAEFMLHRTQVKQVLPVYAEFLERYPTLATVGQSHHIVASRLLAPLGLDWRIQGMLDALKYLWREFGAVPLNYAQLKAVRGIGQYIAGATLVFAGNIARPLIDTNTVRVVGRVFGLDLRGEARRKRAVIDAVATVCHPTRPRDFYYALIDLAHMICRPRQPLCETCPLLNVPCQYGQELIARPIGFGSASETKASKSR